MHTLMHMKGNIHPYNPRNELSLNELEEWQPRQDSNLEILNQNQVCCQLHHGAVALRRGGY